MSEELNQILAILSLIAPPILTYFLALAKTKPQIRELSTKYKQVKTLFEEIESATTDNEITDLEFERIVERSRDILNTHSN
jgi:hypothetical protein